jgi:hypothetical protein
MNRARGVAIGVVLACALVAAMLIDAARRRSARDATRENAIVALVGMPDLALSSSVRWLRHPSQAEPGAAFSDLPSSLDVDPAGAWIGPPRAILRVGSARGRR